VQRAGVDHRLDAVLGEDAIDESPIRDRADRMGVRAGRDVKADEFMASCSQTRGEETSEPARRTRQKDADGMNLTSLQSKAMRDAQRGRPRRPNPYGA
jgi:hypothetical protein